MRAQSFQLCPALCDRMDCSPPGSSVGFSRQKSWSGLPCPPPGALPNPGIKPESPALAGRFFTTEPLGKSHLGPGYFLCWGSGWGGCPVFCRIFSSIPSLHPVDAITTTKNVSRLSQCPVRTTALGTSLSLTPGGQNILIF